MNKPTFFVEKKKGCPLIIYDEDSLTQVGEIHSALSTNRFSLLHKKTCSIIVMIEDPIFRKKYKDQIKLFRKALHSDFHGKDQSVWFNFELDRGPPQLFLAQLKCKRILKL